jgi:glycosyltransferase involved in cell wall biosynthesis
VDGGRPICNTLDAKYDNRGRWGAAVKVVLCKGRFAGPISGSDETLIAYATEMKAAGRDVEVAVLYPHAADDPYYGRLRDAGIKVSCIAQRSVVPRAMQLVKNRVPHLSAGIRRLLQRTACGVSRSYVSECKQYFERSGADVVHVVTPDPAAMAMIRGAHAARIPVLYQELGTPDFLPELKFYYQQLVEVLPLCDDVAALSPALASGFCETLGGFFSGSVLPLMVVDSPAPRANDTSSDEVTFGFAARLEYGKGPLALLEAFTRVARRLSTVSLRIAGDGPQTLEVLTMASAAGLDGRCSLVGTYSGPLRRTAFMRGIDVFVLPTLAEGTPNCIIEAMAHGRPVIASAVGGVPDTLSAGAGVLVPPGDVTALAEAMFALATDRERRLEMGRAARGRYERLFSPAAVLPLLTERYERVVARRRDRRFAVDVRRTRHPWADA